MSIKTKIVPLGCVRSWYPHKCVSLSFHWNLTPSKFTKHPQSTKLAWIKKWYRFFYLFFLSFFNRITVKNELKLLTFHHLKHHHNVNSSKLIGKAWSKLQAESLDSPRSLNNNKPKSPYCTVCIQQRKLHKEFPDQFHPSCQSGERAVRKWKMRKWMKYST